VAFQPALLLLSLLLPAIPAAPAPPFYGSALNADALANTPVGTAHDIQVSYRIRASHGGALKAVRPFFIWSYDKPGYQSRHGGTILVQIQSDDGSAQHLPSGAVLASTVATHPVDDRVGYFPSLSFAQPPQLQAGTLYHVVFSNIDPDPVNNWVCLDSAYMDHASSPMQPTVADTDLATLWRVGSAGAWAPRRAKATESFTPILELDYADGASQGQGYMEFWIGNPKTISGAKAVRQTFTATGRDRQVSGVAVRAKWLSGGGPLTLRLEQADGTVLGQGVVTGLPVTPGFGGASWARVTFAAPALLTRGRAYNLVLSAPAGTVYQVCAMRKGTDKGFKATTLFPDGHAQFNDGTGWTGWDQWGQPNRRDGDLQFYFDVLQ